MDPHFFERRKYCLVKRKLLEFRLETQRSKPLCSQPQPRICFASSTVCYNFPIVKAVGVVSHLMRLSKKNEPTTLVTTELNNKMMRYVSSRMYNVLLSRTK